MKQMKIILLCSLTCLVFGGCMIGEHTGSGGGTGVEGVSGVLVDPSGSPVADAWVKIYTPESLSKRAPRDFSSEAVSPHLSKTDIHENRAFDSVKTSATGAFELPGLASGTYSLHATHTFNDSTYALWIEGFIVTGQTNLGVDTLRLSGSIAIVVESGGLPIEGAECVVANTPFGAHADSTGLCNREGIPPGTFEIVISSGEVLIGVTGDLQVLSGILKNEGVFSVGGPFMPPPAPLLHFPPDGEFVTTADSMGWSPVIGAIAYNVQISTTSTPPMESPIFNDSTLTATSLAISDFAPDILYYWRVRARNSTGFGPWSGIRTFVLHRDSGSTRSRFAIGPTTIALWTFDSLDLANNFIDRSGNGNHLPAPIEAVVTPSPYGNAVFYNGASSVLPGGSALSMVESPHLTFEARIWLDAYPPSTFWNGGSTLMGQYAGLKMFINYQGRIQAASQTGDGTTWTWYAPFTAVGVVPLGQWVDIAVAAVRDSSILYVYINGKPVQTYSATANAAMLRPNSVTEFPFTVGNDGQDVQPFQGRFDEIRISNELVLGRGLAPIIGPIEGPLDGL